MATPYDYARGISCANCKGKHSTIAEVRECFNPADPWGAPPKSHSTIPVQAPPAPITPAFPQSAPVTYSSPVAPPKKPWFDELQIPVGRYAVNDETGTLKFVHVKESRKYPKFRNLYFQASDDTYWCKSRDTKQAILKAILEQGVQLCTVRYGMELGVCGVCGRTLTDEESRAYGIGPICRAKSGWL